MIVRVNHHHHNALAGAGSLPDAWPVRRRLIPLAVAVILGIGPTVSVEAADAPVAEPPSQSDASAASEPDDVNPSIALRGSVWRTKTGIVFLKTPIGMLTLSSKTTFKDLLASQDVTLWVHDADFAVEISKRADRTLLHRYLGGPFKPNADGSKQLIRWTPEGEHSYQYGSHELAFAALRDGDPITVEVNADNSVIGLHNVQFDLQIGQIPTGDSDTHLLLGGTVSKLKSNFIFFRTPIGVVTVNSKIGIRNAKVGQTMTLHIHRQHVVADLAAPNAGSVRFVTGPLRYATPERTSVTLWTPDGEQTFAAEKGKTALAGVKEGAPITVELNGQGTVVAFHRPN